MGDDRKSSYEKINYSLRPAKAVERKMMCDAFRRLAPFAKVESYRYVGFGSAYFSDFTLFHRALGLGDMVSIERDEDNADRFEFNKPFQCIQLEFGESNEVLPRLSWDVRSIVWLDYDGPLDRSVLKDIEFVTTNLSSGSVFVLSYNTEPHNPPMPKTSLASAAEPAESRRVSTRIRDVGKGQGFIRARFVDVLSARAHSLQAAKGEGAQPGRAVVNAKALAEARLRKLEERVGRGKVPQDVSGSDLRNWGLAEVCRQIVHNQIQETLATRNSVLAPSRRYRAKQLFNFQYSDGARMGTVGFVFFDEGQEHVMANCGFSSLPFVCEADVPYQIRVPNLTYREMRRLDSELPAEPESLQLPAVPRDQVEWYARIYRYFPRFAETDA